MSMKIPVKQAVHVELNSAAEEQLDREVGLGPERARRIVESRPFYSWNDVKRVEGFTDAMVHVLAQSGIELGDPARADIRYQSEEHHKASARRGISTVDVLEDGVPSDGRRAPDRRHS
jgi:hypothetical protein